MHKEEIMIIIHSKYPKKEMIKQIELLKKIDIDDVIMKVYDKIYGEKDDKKHNTKTKQKRHSIRNRM